jgi:ubiquinone/menaquinone biosynthesis C-methylase UbiE
MSIKEIHTSKKGKVSDKWSSYLIYYDQLFSSIKNKNINLLEIGVQNGGSLETWAEYFTKGENFIGCDINQKCSALEYKDKRIKLIIGNANSNEIFDSIQTLNLPFDIIIDDGSHLSPDIIKSFIFYFPLLKPGGVYVIEDTHTLYFNNYLGGLYNETSAQKFFYKLVDIINYQFWDNSYQIESILQNWFPNKQVPKFIQEGWIDSISFRNSIITIHKSEISTHNKLGARHVSGDEARVDETTLKFKAQNK